MTMTRYAVAALLLVASIAYSIVEGADSDKGKSDGSAAQKALLDADAAIKVMPDFALPDVNGAEVKPSAFRGKTLIVDFWATWCTVCTAEISDFVALQKKYKDKGVEIVAIAVEGASLEEAMGAVKSLVKKERINYTVLLGTHKTMDAFHVNKGFPTTFIIDKKRRVRNVLVGKKDKLVFENALLSVLKDTSADNTTQQK